MGYSGRSPWSALNEIGQRKPLVDYSRPVIVMYLKSLASSDLVIGIAATFSMGTACLRLGRIGGGSEGEGKRHGDYPSCDLGEMGSWGWLLFWWLPS